MILATVGTQLPFPRLIGLLDEMAPRLSRRVVAQIGFNSELPKNIEYHRNLEPGRFDTLFREAAVIVAHAGMGTVLAAKKHGKPIIIFPRSAALGEHRNEHQLATARALADHPGIYMAEDQASLEDLLVQSDLVPAGDGERPSLKRLLETIANSLRTR